VRQALLAALLILAAGCAVPGSAPTSAATAHPDATATVSSAPQTGVPPHIVASLPPDWRNGTLLHAATTWTLHSDAHGATLNATGIARPAACLAFRGNDSLAGDTCMVRNATAHDPAGWDWALAVSWAGCAGATTFDGCPSAQPPLSWRVVAVGDAGQSVAWWDGQMSRDTQAATE